MAVALMNTITFAIQAYLILSMGESVLSFVVGIGCILISLLSLAIFFGYLTGEIPPRKKTTDSAATAKG